MKNQEQISSTSKSNKVLIFLARFLVGAVFAFSGFVKAVDPLGSCYKFTDYFNLAFDMPWMSEFALPLAFLLSALEFTTGIMLIFNLKPRWAVWFAFSFMVVFLPITLYIALKNPVHDCGCFGDALVLDNWTTFYKNVVLTLIILYLIFNRKKMDNPLSDNAELGIAFAVFLIAIVFQHFMLRHLPILDFRPYKIGNNIAEKMAIPEGAKRDVYASELTYKNSVTGEVKVVTDKELMDNKYLYEDSTWVWQDTKSILLEKGFQPEIHDFTITDTAGTDYAQQVLNFEKPVLLVITHKLEKSDTDGLDILSHLQTYAQKHDYIILGLTSSNWDYIEQIKSEYSVDFPFFQTDDITLKTIVRANPGIVKLEKGTVTGKWNFRDFKYDK
ncbi:MAG: DoxX family protein [Bacteroidales bacterium]|nr:DoxX family protein [Bacteroidales bacterium]